MPEGSRQQAVNVNVTVNAPTIQEGDSISTENTEININNPNIHQMNINQGNNDAPEDPVHEYDINQEANAMNLSSPRDIPPACRKRSRSSTSAGEEKSQDGDGEETSDRNQEVNLTDEQTEKQENAESRKALKTRQNQKDTDGLPEQNQRGKFWISQKFCVIVSFLMVLLSVIFYNIGHDAGRMFVRNSEYKNLQSELLKDKAVFSCVRSNFTKSNSLLEQLTSVPKHEVMSVPLALRTAECYEFLGIKNKTEEAINVTRQLLTTSPYDADDVVDSAVDLVGHGHYFRAIVLLRIASTMYKSHQSLSPDDKVHKIYYCVEKIFTAVIPRLHENTVDSITIKYATHYTIEIINDMREIKNADSSNKAKQGARCIYLILSIFQYEKQHENIIKFAEGGVELLEKHLGHRTQEPKVYGNLLLEIGYAHSSLQNHDNAKLYFIKANDALTKALDFDNEDEKQQRIELSKNNLRKALSKQNDA